MKTKTHIEELLTLMDYWDMISSRAPVTPGCHASQVSLLIDFEK
jgi:hypothetical protein